MAPVLTAFLGIAFIAGTIWFVVALAKKQREKLERFFNDAAELAGGRFSPGHYGFLRNDSPTVTVNRDGATIVADTYVVSSGKSSTTYSRVTAGFALGRGPELHIRREGALHSLGKALGMQDLQIGDPAFDDQFMIKAPSVAVVHRVLPEDDRLTLLHRLPGWWIRSDGTQVVLRRLGHPDSPGEVVAAIGVAAQIATADKRLLDLAAAHPDAHAAGHEVVFAGTVEGRFAVDDHGCKLRAPNRQEGPDVAIDCADGDAAELPEGALEPALAAQLHAIGPARLARDRHHAWVTWRGTPTAEQIDAGWRVLLGLAAPSTRVGAFR